MVVISMLLRRPTLQFGLSLFILVGCLPQLMTLADERYHALTNTDGMEIEARILGFSQGQGPRRESVDTLTADHFVHLIVMVKNVETPFEVKFSIFSEQSQQALKKLNDINIKKKKEPFWNADAVQASKTLLDSYSKLQKDGAGPAAIEAALNKDLLALNGQIRNEPLVRYTSSLVKAKLGIRSASTFETVIRSQPDYWPAWRASVYTKLSEVNVLSAAGKLKSFHGKVMMDLRAAGQNGKIPVKTVKNLVWIKEVTNVLATNDAANKMIRELLQDEEAAVFLARYQKQIDAENAKAKEELQRQTQAERQRIDNLIVKANKEYEQVGGAIQTKYRQTQVEYDKHSPEYEKLRSQADVARSRENVERTRRAAQNSKVNAQSSKISSLRSRRNSEKDEDLKNALDDEIRAEEKILRAEQQSLSAARAAVSAANSAANAAAAVAREYYNSVLAPLKVKMKNLENEFFAFSTRFRVQYKEAIANDPNLKKIFDKWDAMIARKRKAQLGVSRFNTITRKDKKAAAKEQQKKDALELLSVINFSVDEEIQSLSQELAVRSQPAAP